MLKFQSFFFFFFARTFFSIGLIGIEVSYGTTECIPKCIADEGERIAEIHAKTNRTLRCNESKRIRIFQKGFFEKRLLNLVSYNCPFVSKHILSSLTIIFFLFKWMKKIEEENKNRIHSCGFFFSSSETLSS